MKKKKSKSKYLEPVQRNVYVEPTPREDPEAEPKIPFALVPTEQPEPEIENGYKPIIGMDELE